MVQWEVVKKLLQYVRRTPERGFAYGGNGNSRTVMRAFVDSDHVTCLDTRRSISGGAILLGGGAISWFLRAQATTGGNFGDIVRGRIGDREGGATFTSGSGLYHACPRV